MKEHDFDGALKAFDEILTLLTTNQRGIIQFLEDDVRHALTLTKKMQDEGTIKRYMEIMRLSNVENAKAHIRAMIQAAQEGNDER